MTVVLEHLAREESELMGQLEATRWCGRSIGTCPSGNGECCGVVLALIHWRQYVWGRHFKCVTDDAALTHRGVETRCDFTRRFEFYCDKTLLKWRKTPPIVLYEVHETPHYLMLGDRPFQRLWSKVN